MMKNFVATVAIATALSAASAQAATVQVEVFADTNAAKTESGAATGIILALGEIFSVSADPLDTWAYGLNKSKEVNADGARGGRLVENFGQQFVIGSLVARIGTGAFFSIGTAFNGLANAAGELQLYFWDRNLKNNSGSIVATIETADIAPVPLPASAPLLLAGLIGFAALRRRRS